MKKTWCVLFVWMAFALGALAQPSLQTLVTNQFSEPYGVTVDEKNNCYIADSVNNRIAKYISSAGSLTNVAGVFGEAGSNDGPGVFAHFASPQGIVYVKARGGLVVADSGNHRIRFIDLNGTVTTLAGSTAGFKDGTGTAAQFNAPAGLAADSAGNVYVADLLNNRVRKIDLANTVTTVATGFARPTAVTLDQSRGLIYVTDTGTHSVRVIRPDGTVSLFAGSGSSFISGSKNSLVATNALFNAPRGLLWVSDKAGLLVADTGNQLIRRVYYNTNYNTYAVENYVSSPVGSPVGLAVDSLGNYPLVDMATGSLMLIQVTAQQPPVSNPKIGIVIMTTNFFGDIVTQLNPAINSTFNNDVKVAILGEEGTETSYTLDPDANFPDEPASRNTPLPYSDGLSEWTNSIVVPSISGSNVLVRAIGTQDGRRPSDVISARFQFKVSNPVINGKNPSNFTLSDATEAAQLWYTTDGSTPTNQSPSSLYTPESNLNIVNGTNNVLFKLRAFKPGYTPSAEVSKLFLFSDLESSAIGIARDYKAGVGSTIVVPIEVRVAGADALRSLQFLVEVTPNNGAPPISEQLRALPISTNDFISIPAPSINPPISRVHFSGTTTALEVDYVGESSGLKLQGTAVAALLALPIPPTATVGQSYTLHIAQPSGTSDAKQNPVPLMVLDDRIVTVANLSYVVGDSAIAVGYNAGDFGNGNLSNNDVNNALHVSLGLYNVFPFTDLFDAMDAFPSDSASTVGGDGQIRFLDWQLILSRSLRLNDTANWQRAWSAGGLRMPATATLNGVADTPGNMLTATPAGAVWVKQASLNATSVANAQPGQKVQVPIYVKIADGASLSGLQFLAKVMPSPAAPHLATRAEFVPAPETPAGRAVDGLAPQQVAYAWDLDSFNPPLQGRVLLGNVVFTVPPTALPGQAYLVRFSNADGAPDQETQYDFETFSGAVTVNAPANPAQDPISDDWKIHFFGSVDQAQADPGADPDNDGSPNWQEYLAGTDPTDAHSHLHLQAPASKFSKGQKQMALRWLSAPGKRYLIESSTDVAGGTWTTMASGIAGDGAVKEFLDTNAQTATRYYRVRLQD